MSVFLARGGSAAAVLALTAQGALADVSAQDVWSDWKAYMSGMGYTFAGTESQSGGTLTVSDIAMSFPMPEAEGSASFAMPELRFIENGDGTVNIELPAEFPMTVSGQEGSDKFSVEILYTHDGAPVVVSGDASKMHYAYTTAKATLSLSQIEATGEDIPADALKASIEFTGLTSKTDMTIAGQRSYDQNIQAAGLSYDLNFKEPKGNDSALFKGQMQNLAMISTSTVPEGASNPADFGGLVKAGLAAKGSFTYGGGNGQIAVKDGNDSFDLQSSSTGGTFGFGIGQEGISYDINHQGVALNVAGSEIPFPLALNMAELGFKLAMPIMQSNEEQGFALGVTLRDFAVPEMLWGMVDPAGNLPHDPATVILDLTGKAKLLFDLLDPKSIEAVERGQAQPGELNAVSINNFLVSAAGAKLTGTGDFTFDNTDLQTFDGMPAPDGVANIELTGANGLIDKLIQMGLVSDSDAMGARMMMGMFGVPGEGEDTLTSEIKVSGDGQIHANGQRIK